MKKYLIIIPIFLWLKIKELGSGLLWCLNYTWQGVKLLNRIPEADKLSDDFDDDFHKMCVGLAFFVAPFLIIGFHMLPGNNIPVLASMFMIILIYACSIIVSGLLLVFGCKVGRFFKANWDKANKIYEERLK